MEYTVRNAHMTDLDRIEQIYAYARSFMKENGNPDQWGNSHPPHEQLVKDIDAQSLYVVEDQSGMHGVFFFYVGPDATYDVIHDGQWRSDTPYGTIHRIAGDGSGGILKTAVKFASERIAHIRIDTHQANYVMQNALQRLDFQKRGIIYISDGSPRIAYDKLTDL